MEPFQISAAASPLRATSITGTVVTATYDDGLWGIVRDTSRQHISNPKTAHIARGTVVVSRGVVEVRGDRA